MSQGVRAVNKLCTGKLHATRLFRSDKWMKYEQSALVADPGWKTWWELDERETGKPVPVPGTFPTPRGEACLDQIRITGLLQTG